MDDILETQATLQREANDLIHSPDLLPLLQNLGSITQTGSSITGLMVYPDIDFAIQNVSPNFQNAIDLVPEIFSKLKAKSVKLADFKTDENESANYYIGFDIPFKGKVWHIDATVGEPGPIVTDPPELVEWVGSMTQEQREIILRLKGELIKARRYVGSRSQPPYTFRSSHVYEGVIKGDVTSVEELEAYFR